MLELAQAEFLGTLQAILDGGLPLLLLVALVYVGKLYKKEKESKENILKDNAKEVETLKTAYSDKVETLLRERIDSELDNQKMRIEQKELMKSVLMSINNVNEFLESIVDEDE